MRSPTVGLLGFGAIAVVIGLLVGISSTPVVGVVIPLVFSLVTAGAAVLATRAAVGDRDAAIRSTGGQLLAFSVGFLFGLWFGVGAKLHARAIWFDPAPQVAYGGLDFVNSGDLSWAIQADQQMINSGLSFDERRAILEGLWSSRRERLALEEAVQAVFVNSLAAAAAGDTLASAALVNALTVELGGEDPLTEDASSQRFFAQAVIADSALATGLITLLRDPRLRLPAYGSSWVSLPSITTRGYNIIAGVQDDPTGGLFQIEGT